MATASVINFEPLDSAVISSEGPRGVAEKENLGISIILAAVQDYVSAKGLDYESAARLLYSEDDLWSDHLSWICEMGRIDKGLVSRLPQSQQKGLGCVPQREKAKATRDRKTVRSGGKSSALPGTCLFWHRGQPLESPRSHRPLLEACSGDRTGSKVRLRARASQSEA